MKRKLSAGFTLIELMIVVAIIGILASIAVPNFLSFQTRARQAEAKANLAAFFTAAKSYFAVADTYGCGTCGFKPEAGNRYKYAVDGTNTIATDTTRWPANTCTSPTAAQSASAFTASATANIDSDATCDAWTINDANLLTNTINDVDL